MGGAGSTWKAWAPGRVARSAATIVLRPVRGSIRTSGKRPLHPDVLDPGLHEPSAALRVSGRAVHAPRAGLGVEHDALRSGGARLRLAEGEQAAADAAPARFARHHEAPELARRALEQQPAGADHRTTVDCHQVEGVVVAAVDLLRPRDPLLVTEHPNAELGRSRALGRVAGAARRDGRRGGAHRRNLSPRAKLVLPADQARSPRGPWFVPDG